ncbi:hypothetical protein PR003_g17603 [Phytophthora rubi]|uniref:Uncharacterized protein n=1 Tax=Phytophthora rubi TaxID=129364 RepID=A0A6A4EE16_9STRA|nr:hypothetical protein PR001_g25949 [Phytophthora rubi]KAE9320894.1 hypothetical protein PR003_g17603 [Phytophthora rubi]
MALSVALLQTVFAVPPKETLFLKNLPDRTFLVYGSVSDQYRAQPVDDVL